jgi:ATP-dependent Lon protease
VKEQQKRCFQSEFHNTHLGCILGPDGVEQFVWTSEFHADKAIDSGVPMASI